MCEQFPLLCDILETLETVWLFLWSLVKFIVFAFKTLFNLIWKAFTYIFSPDLFNSIWDSFKNLVVYMGSPSAVAFLSLFLIAFLLVFIWFIFRVIKWQVHYKAVLKKYQK